MSKRYWTTLLLIPCALIPGMLSGTDKAEVEYPLDYRSWTRVKSMVILEGHVHHDAFGGFHHVYANDKALEAMKKVKPYPMGSILVFELYEEVKDNHAISEGSRKVIGVMEKQGGSTFGGPNFDKQIYVPISSYVKAFGGARGTDVDIAVKAPSVEAMGDLEYELIGEMRKVRKLRPMEEENFSINKLDTLMGAFNSVIGVVLGLG